MSRSYRKTPIHGHGGGSEKQDKRTYNRCLRSATRQALHTCDDFDALVLPEVRDVSNPWSMSKDGKSWSNWLAGYRATMVKVTRVRAGRRRYLLTLSARTVELAEKENAVHRLRLFGLYDNWDWMARFDASHNVDLIRK